MKNTSKENSHRGPKPKISHDAVFQVLETFREKLFDLNGKLMPCTSNIWTIVSNNLDNKMSAKNLYISVYQNRHLWFSRLTNSTDSPDIVQSSSIDSESDNGSSKSEKRKSSSTESNLKCFSIEISYSKFVKMNPIKVIYGKNKHRKEYTVLKPGAWTNIINDEFLKNYKMPCTYVYRRCRISNDFSRSKHFLTFQAKCKDCGVFLRGWADRKPEDGFPLQLNIETEDTRDSWEDHHSKRPLNGKKRSNVGKELSKDTASNWQRHAVSSMEFGDHIPPNLYNKSVLWKCKQQFMDNFLGINEKCPISSIIELKHGKYAGSIHTICADKLFIHYWTPTQLIIYKHVHKSYCRLSIDATGSLIKKLKRSKQNILSSHIFLYEAVVNTANYQVPVTQMISEKHDTLTIFYWLAEWIKDGIPVPQETACDYSKALLGAISRAFCNGVTLSDYVNKCFSVLLLKSNNDLPPCFIRIDIAHLVKMVCRWKCLTGTKNYRLKEFYVRCIILLVESSCLENFEKLLLDILTVSMSQTEGETIAGTGICPEEKARTRLLNNIRGCKIIETDAIKSTMENIDLLSDRSDEEFDDLSTELNENTKINEFLNMIKSKGISKSLVEGDRISPYDLPEFTKNLLRLCKEFPLWSNIMCSVFKSPYKSATSAAVEGDFALLKKNILKHNTASMTVDRFLVTHLMSIESTMKIARSSQIKEYISNEINKTNKGNYNNIIEGPVHRETPIMSPSSSLGSISADNENEFDVMENEHNTYKNHQHSNKNKEEGIHNNGKEDMSPTSLSYSSIPVDKKYECDMIEKEFSNNTNQQYSNKNKKEGIYCNDSETDDYIQQVTPILSPTSSFDSGMTLDQEETWGGLTTFETGPLKHSLQNSNKSGKNKIRPTKYVDTCPEIDRILNRSKMRSHMSSLILNGNISPLCIFNKKTYVINNTCPFDSVIVAIAVAYIDYEQYASFIDETQNEFLNLAKDLGLHGSSKLIYRKRLMLLMPYFDISTCIPSVNTLNAECNVLKVINDYMKHNPSSTQITMCLNKNCPGEDQIRHSATIILNNLYKVREEGFSFLQNLLEKYLKSKSKPCIENNCNNVIKSENSLGNHFFFETDQLSTASSTFTCFLSEIPVNIHLNNEKYILVAVIHYQSFHYMTYIRRITNHWELHNDLSKKIEKIKNYKQVKVNPHAIMYIKL